MRIYDGGTVSVGAGATSVTGSATAWAGTVRPGDMLWIAGLVCRIASVETATALTLAKPWPGTAVTNGAYEIQLTPSEVAYGEAVRDLVDALGNSGLAALADITAAADRLPYFDGTGTGATTSLTAIGRTLVGLIGSAGAKVPVVSAAGVAGLKDVVGVVSHASGVPTGAFVETGSNGNGAYWRFAGGLQVCLVSERVVSHNGSDNNQLRGSWAFPVPFSAVPVTFWTLNPVRQVAGDTDRARLSSIWTESYTAGVNLYALRQQGQAAWSSGDKLSGIDLFAIGRWHA
ncbi:hypothetical protein [Haematobacter massiliensis]|uniref:hypothetical protein n=1 Tax=Haematobacter massiliensis TaxID=195105 RepID=UPI0023F32FA1|nr:hypothetical protein [Haematobacter massiliensis]